MRDNPLVQWVIAGFSVVAFILLLKVGASYLPDNGVPGAIKKVLGTL